MRNAAKQIVVVLSLRNTISKYSRRKKSAAVRLDELQAILDKVNDYLKTVEEP